MLGAAAFTLTGALESSAAELTTTQSFAAVADAYVSSKEPAANFGSESLLRVDSSNPVASALRARSYVRFEIQGLTDPVTRAIVRFRADDGDNGGFEIRDIAGSSWSEGTITWENAPSVPSGVVASSGSFSAGDLVGLDVTSLIHGNGSVDLLLTTSSMSPMALSSREGVAAPELVITTSVSAPSNGVPPTIAGRAQEGESLSADPGTWSGTTPISYAYDWQRCDAGGNDCAATGVDAASYAVGPSDVGSTLRAAVTASNAVGSSTAMSASTAVVAACPVAPEPAVDDEPPSAPGNPSVSSSTNTTLEVVWSASNDNVGVTAYTVFVDGVTVSAVTRATVALRDLTCGTTYTIGVDAWDAAGNRSEVVTVRGTTASCSDPPPPPPPPSPGDTTPPSQPQGLLGAASTGTSVSLTWLPSTDDVGVVGYGVYVNGSGSSSWSEPAATVSELSCGTAYTFEVDAHDAAGNRSGRVSVTAATDTCGSPSPPPSPGDTTPPSQPQGLVGAASTGTSVSLTWLPSTDDVGVVGYGVYVNGSGSSSWSEPAATVSELSCGTAYTFEVDAHDAAGNRSGRVSVSASTSACLDEQPPTAPDELVVASVGATSIELSWPASSDNVGVTGYGLYTGGAHVGTTVATAATFSGLACGMDYALGVDAYDAAGNRSRQATVLVATSACLDTTPPSTPTDLATSSVTATSLTLTWEASSDNVGVTGYDIYRNGTKMSTVSTTSSSQTGLACGTSYAFSVTAHDAAGNVSGQAALDASSAACAQLPPPATVPSLQQVDGGTSYYGGFSNGLPTTDDYFPIAVWFESVTSQADVDTDKDVGLNTYIVVTANSDLRLVNSNGMKAFVQSSERSQFNPQPEDDTAGWELDDEIDMVQANAAGAAAARTRLSSILAGLPNDGRLRYNNYGKGVIFWNDDSDAAKYVNDFQDVVSTDVYWFNDDDACEQYQGGLLLGLGRALTSSECHRASNYGAQVLRVRSLVSPAGSKPVWAFVEVGRPFSNMGAGVTGQQVRAAVWHSLIAGARGIIYFNHNFGGPCISQHVLREDCGAAVRPAVKAMNQQIYSLAPVLNAPFVKSGWTNDGATRAMVKWQDGHFYVFAASANNAASTSDFSVPCVGNATATVVDENRSIPIAGGRWSDSFANGNAVHIYRIDGGSSCGLS